MHVMGGGKWTGNFYHYLKEGKTKKKIFISLLLSVFVAAAATLQSVVGATTIGVMTLDIMTISYTTPLSFTTPQNVPQLYHSA
jgi:hypothetical protein